MILCTETGMHAAHRLYERRGYAREPAPPTGRSANVRLLAYRLALLARQAPKTGPSKTGPSKTGAAPARRG